MPGPQPKPRSLKLVDGSYRRDRDQGAPELKRGRPTLPRTIKDDEIARGEWNRLCRLGKLVITKADGPMLEAACRAYARWVRAEEDLADHGGGTYSTKTKSGSKMIRPHPAVAIASEAWRRYTAALAHFGLSPATRSKAAPATPPKDKEPLPEESYRI